MSELIKKQIAILEKTEQITKDKLKELFQELYENKGELKFDAVLSYAMNNMVIMYIKTTSEITDISSLQIFSKMADTVISKI